MVKPDSIFSLCNKKDWEVCGNMSLKYAPCYPRKAPVLMQNTDTHTHTCKQKKTASWMNTLSCTIKTKMKTCNKTRMLSCVRNVTEVLSDRWCSLFPLLEGNRTTQLLEYVNISGLGHTRDFQLQHPPSVHHSCNSTTYHAHPYFPASVVR
jgi:hypothetical protein